MYYMVLNEAIKQIVRETQANKISIQIHRHQECNYESMSAAFQ